MNKTLFITGGAGFIGSHVVRLFVNKYPNYKIVNVDALTYAGNLENLSDVDELPNYCFEKVDIVDAAAVDALFDKYQPEGVIHLAAESHVDRSIEDPLAFVRTNILGTVNLLKALTRVNAKAVVFSSSATLYGQSASGVCFETDPTIPINPYGWTKLMSEQVLRDWVEADRSRRAICLRYFNPIGAHESGLLGEPVNGKQANLLPALIDVWLKRTGELAVFGGDYNTFDGTAERDYVHIYDIANGHVQVLEHICQMSSFETLNLGTGKSTTVLNLIREFERACGDEIPVNICDRRDGDSQSCYANVEKARQLIGFECRKTLYEACVDACNYATKNFDPQHDR